MKHEHTVL